MKHYADRESWEVVFQVGDYAFHKLQAYRQKSLAMRINEKLALATMVLTKFYKKIRKVAYKLELPQHALIHPIFHVSQLKPVNTAHELTDLAPQTADLVFNVQPEDIVVVQLYKTPECEVLVPWQGLPSSKASWEHYATLKENISKGRWRRL